jgi:hypothetical protein
MEGIMGFSLKNESGESFSIENQTWSSALDIARRYGWKPMGTLPNPDFLKKRARDPDGGYDENMYNELMKSWDGSYLTKENQTVTYADALNMAFALEEALDAGLLKKSHLAKIIAFCKKGGFSIK